MVKNKIYFDDLNPSWWYTGIMLIAVILILMGFLMKFENQQTNKVLSAIGFLIQTIYFSKQFWFKHYVQWNKKGAYVRVNSFVGKTIRFSLIKSVELEKDNLILIKNDGQKIVLNLKQISVSDTKKLHKIMVKNTLVISKRGA